jgi:quinol monooxygenase YgiN
MNEIVIIAKLKIKEHFYTEVYEELKILHKNTHKYDRGCIQYDLHKNLEDKHSFVFIETWSSMNMLQEHEEKEHFKIFIRKVENKLESIQIDKFKK